LTRDIKEQSSSSISGRTISDWHIVVLRHTFGQPYARSVSAKIGHSPKLPIPISPNWVSRWPVIWNRF
jgi:hypothetical protein